MLNDTKPSLPPLREALQDYFRLARLIRSYWVPLIKGTWVGIAIGTIGLVTPYLTKLFIDQVYPARDVALMHLIVLGVLALGLTQALVSAIRTFFTAHVMANMSADTTLLFFNHLQHQPVKFFDQNRVGEILARFGDLRTSLGTASRTTEVALTSGVYLILVPPILFLLQWKLAIVALFVVPWSVLISLVSARVLRPYWRKGAEANAEVNAYQVEAMNNIRTLKSLAAERSVFLALSERLRKALSLQLRARGLSELFGLANSSIRQIAMAIFTWYAWTLILRSEMTLGDYVAFSSYVGFFFNPLSQITSLLSEFQASAVSFRRMFEYLDLQPEQNPEIAYGELPVYQPLPANVISVQNVDFSHREDRALLRNVSIEIKLGESTAIVGPSGVGKTSLFRLLSRVNGPSSGAIWIGGRNVQSIPHSELRRQITVVWQDVGLLQGTVWENLTLGVDNPNEQDVHRAAKICGLDAVIHSLAEGYNTKIGEWGATLSAGQRQRFALTRALIRNSPILLLDEATSSIDQESEMLILPRILEYYRERIVVFVTHRMSAAAMADRIVVVQEDGTVEIGTHSELLVGNATYARLVRATSHNPTSIGK